MNKVNLITNGSHNKVKGSLPLGVVLDVGTGVITPKLVLLWPTGGAVGCFVPLK